MMRIVAFFESAQQIERAAGEAERAGWRVVGACAPAFNDRVVSCAHATRSPVAGAAFAGGLIGLASGALLTIGTVREWPVLIVSGKPLLSLPPFLIIMFELTILAAGLAGAMAFAVAGARARRRAAAACDATTSDNRLSLLLDSGTGSADGVYELTRRIDPIAWRRVTS